jgi:hypothetical protein
MHRAIFVSVASATMALYLSTTKPPHGTPTSRVTKESKQASDESHSRLIFAEGVHWKVFEHERLGHTLERTLVFSPAEGTVRRVSRFPRNWRSLDDAALFELARQKQ